MHQNALVLAEEGTYKSKGRKKKCYMPSCNSAFYTRRTLDQKRCYNLGIGSATDEQMIPQRTIRPSNARVSERLDPLHPSRPTSQFKPLLLESRQNTRVQLLGCIHMHIKA